MVNYIKFTFIAFVCVMVSFGCSSATSSTSGSSSSSSGSSDSSTSYVGSSSISGTVSVQQSDASQLSYNSDGTSASSQSISVTSVQKALSTIKPNVISALSDQTIMADGLVKVYAISATGNYIDTGVTATTNSSGAYKLENLKDGIKYMVEAIKIGYDKNGKKNAIRQKSFANIKSGASSTTSDVSQKTGKVLEYIIEKLVKIANSLDLDDSIVDILITTVTDTITQLITSGTLKIDSSVTPIESNVTADQVSYSGSKTVNETTDTDLINKLDSDDSGVSCLVTKKRRPERGNCFGSLTVSRLIENYESKCKV